MGITVQTYVNWVKTKYVWIRECLKIYCVDYSVLLFIILIACYFIWPCDMTKGLAIASLASIFAALKYKLDQANYNKDLFNKRYKVFLAYQKAVIELSNLKSSGLTKDKLTHEILDPVFGKSYFLFGDKTCQFLMTFRGHAINIVCANIDNSEFDQGELAESRGFIDSLKAGQNLSEKFPELKLDSYLDKKVN
jgi:hypothetical protein